MQVEEVRNGVRETILDVLDLDDGFEITDATVASDVPRWDSLRHVRIVLSVERKFKVRFDEGEIGSLKSVGDLFNLVTKKVSSKV